MVRNELLHKEFDTLPSAPPPPVLDVTCLGCFNTILETTPFFAEDKVIHAKMFRPKAPYNVADYSGAEIATDSIAGENIVCPHCSERMCDSDGHFYGRLASREEPETVVEVEEKPMPFTCHICGEGFEKAWQKAIHARKTGHKKVKK